MGFKEVVSIQKNGNAVNRAPSASKATTRTGPNPLRIDALPRAKLQSRDDGDDREQHDRYRGGKPELVVAEALLVDVERHRCRRMHRATLREHIWLIEELHPVDQGRHGHEEDREAHQWNSDSED